MREIKRQLKSAMRKLGGRWAWRTRATRAFLHQLRDGSQPIILNRAINLDMGVIFVAIPKNGTTSVRSQLMQGGMPLIPHPHLDIRQIRDSMYTLALRSTLGNNRSFPSSDVPTEETVRAHAEAVFSALFKFGAVRNPWARAVSLWYRARPKLIGHMPFEQFIEHHVYASDTCVHPTLHRNQLDWLCDESGTVIMDYVYKLEDFDQAIKEIAERTEGRLMLKPVHLNRNPNSAANAYRNLYSDHTRALVARRFEMDIDYFKYSF